MPWQLMHFDLALILSYVGLAQPIFLPLAWPRVITGGGAIVVVRQCQACLDISAGMWSLPTLHMGPSRPLAVTYHPSVDEISVLRVGQRSLSSIKLIVHS